MKAQGRVCETTSCTKVKKGHSTQMVGTYHSKMLFVCQHGIQDTPIFVHLGQTGS